MQGLVALLFLVLSLPLQAADDSRLNLEAFRAASPPPAPLLILGTFHFSNPGLDSYKPDVDVNILSPQRQRELDEVLDRLAAFAPGKIALEAMGERAESLQAEYREYLAGKFELGTNEIYQLGFRLAKRLGHERLHFVDADGRARNNDEASAVAKACGQDVDAEAWNERYFALYRHDDHAKANRTLRETFLYMNSPERLIAGHGHYLVNSFHLGCKDNYYGADLVTDWWYSRNLRIFANLGRIREPGERMLLVIGAGHVPILQHAAQASPEFELVEVSGVLGD